MSTHESLRNDNMGLPHEIPQSQQQGLGNTAQDLTLQVDFSWKKFKSLITNRDDPQSTPIYIVHHKLTKPHLTFNFATDDKAFATGSLHTFSIDADCEIHGRPIPLKALKRFKTEYMHHSYAFANGSGNDGDAETARMTWTSTSDFKAWDFICLDENQMPVAKFSVNVWAVKKVGNITFMGSNNSSVSATGSISDAVRDEIVVTGLTLFYCMVLRMNSILSLFGAVFSRPGHDEKKEEKEREESTMAISEQRQ